MKVYDLSMAIENGMPTYPGDPAVSLRRMLEHREAGYNIMALALGTHSGTHVDVPLHHLEEGPGADQFPLERFLGPAVFLHLDKVGSGLIEVADLQDAGMEIRAGEIVVVGTGWENHRGGADYFQGFPYFASEVADFFIQKRVKAVGCDMPSVDGPGGGAPVHHKLLAAGIPVVEALANLEPLRGRRAFFCAAPLKIAGGDGSPVRALAVDWLIG